MQQNLYTAIETSVKAGKKVMEIYSKDFSVDFKEDASPLTEADQKGNEVIMRFLLPTSIPIISEENKKLPYEQRKDWEQCWLVDPLDGTKEFIKKNGEFTVNIALIQNQVPIMGVVYLPAQKILYFGSKQTGSYKYILENEETIPDLDFMITNSEKLETTQLPDVYTIVASRSHMSSETEEFIQKAKQKYGEVNLISKGSSIKICLVAERKAHTYPRIAPTMEWDTAAAHAVAKYAGCSVTDFYNQTELKYNKENLLNPYFVVSNER